MMARYRIMVCPVRRVNGSLPGLFVVVLAGLAVVHGLSAQAPAGDYQPGSRVRAGIYVDPPVTIAEEYGGYSGMAVELWDIVAKRLDLHTEYVVFDRFPDMLEACRNGDIDIAVHTLAVNSRRASYLWYSFPWHLATSRIMVREQQRSTFWAEFQRFRHFRAYAIFLVVFTAMVISMTVLRRRLEKDFPADWKTGITLSMLDVIKALRSGKLNQTKMGWLGCLLSVLWMIFGVTASAYLTSSVATAMTGSNLKRHELTSVSQLPGKRIGVLTGDSTQVALDDLGLDTVHFLGVRNGIQGLLDGKVEALVTNADALQWYDQRHPEWPVEVVGEKFFARPCGFATSRHNVDFMDRVSVELIWLYETGKIEEIRSRYLSGR
ncbi:MAG: transporter substrate-binding domain-containing protein [Planctomycetes bacterium]|nr:transporter substrate-binding domain-containing protein [Planctomycetota bacterium]